MLITSVVCTKIMIHCQTLFFRNTGCEFNIGYIVSSRNCVKSPCRVIVWYNYVKTHNLNCIKAQFQQNTTIL